jgi:hypothetical protein
LAGRFVYAPQGRYSDEMLDLDLGTALKRAGRNWWKNKGQSIGGSLGFAAFSIIYLYLDDSPQAAKGELIRYRPALIPTTVWAAGYFLWCWLRAVWNQRDEAREACRKFLGKKITIDDLREIEGIKFDCYHQEISVLDVLFHTGSQFLDANTDEKASRGILDLFRDVAWWRRDGSEALYPIRMSKVFEVIEKLLAMQLISSESTMRDKWNIERGIHYHDAPQENGKIYKFTEKGLAIYNAIYDHQETLFREDKLHGKNDPWPLKEKLTGLLAQVTSSIKAQDPS